MKTEVKDYNEKKTTQETNVDMDKRVTSVGKNLFDKDKKVKVIHKHEGCTAKEAQIIVELSTRIEDIINTHKNNIRNINKTLENINVDVSFLKEAKKHFPNKKWGDDYIGKRLEMANQNISNFNKQIVKEQEHVDTKTEFLEEYQSRFNVSKEQNEDNLIVTWEFDMDFYRPMIKLANVIGLEMLLDPFDKEELSEEEKEEAQGD